MIASNRHEVQEQEEQDAATRLVRVRKAAWDLLHDYCERLGCSMTDAASEAIADWAVHTAEARVRFNAKMRQRRESKGAAPARRKASA